MSDYAALKKLIEEQHVEMIDLKYSDLFGRWQHVTLPTSAFSEEILTSGVPFDGSSVPGFKTPTSSDLSIIPDPKTAQLDPFWHVKTLSLICQASDIETGDWFSHDPRVIAQKASDYMRAQGIATESQWLVELEFYIFNNVAFSTSVNTSSYQIDSDEGHWNTGSLESNQLGSNIPHQGGYHAVPPYDRLHNLRATMTMMIEAAGVPVRYHHHEVGGPGQCEIELTRMPMLAAADGTMQAKHIIKNLAIRRGLSPTFMPKPLYNEAGSGMHYHQNLVDGDTNLFYDGHEPDGLSNTAIYYIGGLLKHGRALLAFTNPSTNSYKRLVPGFEAPTRLFYGPANRSAAVRIPKYTNDPSNQRIEFRPPDGSCNVYLAMAAQLLAGLDGIKNQIDPREFGWGPFSQDVKQLPAKQLKRIAQVPSSLVNALEALRKDYQFLTESGVFPESVIETWIDYKQNREANEIRNRPHPYEMTLYYDV